MLMRPLLITPTLHTEIAACGGFLSKFAGNLELDKNEKGGEIDVREQARILYVNLCDYTDHTGKFVPLKEQVEAIKLISEYLFCTWEVAFWGRKHNNFPVYYEKIKKKIQQRIEFYKPSHIFVQEGLSKVIDNSYVVTRAVRNIVSDLPNRVSLYTFNTANNDGIYHLYSSYDEEVKLVAYSHVSALSENIFATTEQVRANDKDRGRLVGTQRAEVFKPINIIHNHL